MVERIAKSSHIVIKKSSEKSVIFFSHFYFHFNDVIHQVKIDFTVFVLNVALALGSQ